MAYNNKINRLAQNQEAKAIKDLALQSAGTMAVQNIKENTPENALEFGAKKGIEKLAPQLMQKGIQNPTMVQNVARGAGGAALGFGLEAGKSLYEEMQGPKKIFENYYQDYVKLLSALASEFPQNQELQNMVNLGRQIGQKSLQTMMSSNVQGPTLGQAISTGFQTAKDTAGGMIDMSKMVMGVNPTTASYNHKNQRLAIVGEAEIGRTLGGAATGVVGSALTGPVGMAIGGAVGAGVPILQNLYHHTRSNEYQAAAYTNELKVKGASLVAQLQKVNPQAAEMLNKYIYDLDNYVKQKIYKGGGTAFEKGIDAVTKFFSREKDEEVDQSTVDQANQLAGQGSGDQAEGGENSQNYLGGNQQTSATDSPQAIEIGVQKLAQIYQTGMQYYNAGNMQAYNEYKQMYDSGMQEIKQMIAQSNPNVNPDQVINQYFQQSQAASNLQQPQ
jgi:hypothetical protein